MDIDNFKIHMLYVQYSRKVQTKIPFWPYSPGLNGFLALRSMEPSVWLTVRWCASSARMARMTSRIRASLNVIMCP